MSGHKVTKSTGSRDTVNDEAVQRQFTFLSGEICLTGDRSLSGKVPQYKHLGSWVFFFIAPKRETKQMETDSASVRNYQGDEAEVSRRHINQTPTVMGRTR